MKNISNITSYVTCAYGLANIKEVLGIVILVLSICNILFNMVIRIYSHIKAKKFKEVSQDFKDAIDELKDLEDNKNG